ncbi:MAG: hypothetical protein J7L61_03015 [Thermoplasmata archaeon]|nr:hypothetical protein [Thermoplasmata archaeon]
MGHVWRTPGSSVSGLFLSSYKHGKKVYQAMLSRGYDPGSPRLPHTESAEP